ncbi:hypothetical protein CRUP_020944 [Coryphaenoides rupestris]|nr:hypothetical protein CRUP_020944 [Coryphaenoides rupestris]
MQVPVGKHVYLKTRVQDAEMVKPYTPVGPTLVPEDLEDPEVPEDPEDPGQTRSSDLYLMIKVYPDGLFTSHLNTLDIAVTTEDCG